MNLTISTEQTKSGLFGGGDYKLKARLNASEAELETIRKLSLGGLELAKLPSSFGSKYPYEAVYLGEVLNRDWERKLKTKQEAENAEFVMIDACKGLKARMEKAAESSGPKNIEL